MRYFIVAIIVASLLLGGFAMESMMTISHQALHICPVAQLLGSDCSLVDEAPLALHHIDGLLALTEAIPVGFLLLLLSVLILNITWFRFESLFKYYGLNLCSYFRVYCTLLSLKIPIFLEPLRWAALHNKRDIIPAR